MKDLKIILKDDVLKVTLPPEIDHHTVQGVRKEIDEALYLHRPSELVISLDNVSFMDSSGLGLILGRYTKAKDLGAAIRLQNPDKRTEKILSFAGIERIIPIEYTGKL